MAVLTCAAAVCGTTAGAAGTAAFQPAPLLLRGPLSPDARRRPGYRSGSYGACAAAAPVPREQLSKGSVSTRGAEHDEYDNHHGEAVKMRTIHDSSTVPVHGRDWKSTRRAATR